MELLAGGKGGHSSDYAKSSHYVFLALCCHLIHQISELFTSWFLCSTEKLSEFEDAV
jgi:hypothetical protein